MRPDRHCENCAGLISHRQQPSPSNHKGQWKSDHIYNISIYCSRRCKVEAMSITKITLKPCESCGENIPLYRDNGTKRGTQAYRLIKYCSAECRSAASGRKRVVDYIADKPCRNCGNIIPKFKESGAKICKAKYEQSVYCNRKCFYEDKKKDIYADQKTRVFVHIPEPIDQFIYGRMERIQQ